MTSISFLIVNYRTASLVVKLVGTIHEYIKTCPYEILICDNSADQLEERTLRSIEDEHCRLCVPEKNLGFVAANNLLAREAGNDILVLINPDVLLIDSSLEMLCEYAARRSDIGAAGPMLLNEDGSYQTDHYRFPNLWLTAREHFFSENDVYSYAEHDSGPSRCDVVKGACIVIKRETVEKYGLFDPDLVMYSEEVELCYRLTKNGLPSVYFPDARIIHYGEASSQQASVYSVHHYNRSKIIFWKKNFSKLRAFCVRYIVYLSLIEKTIVLFLAGKRKSARVAASAVRLIIKEFGV